MGFNTARHREPCRPEPCHPEEAAFSASPRMLDEGPMQLAASMQTAKKCGRRHEALSGWN